MIEHGERITVVTKMKPIRIDSKYDASVPYYAVNFSKVIQP
jgi:hypothetical protein